MTVSTKPYEQVISDPEHVRVVLRQECDGIIEGVKAIADVSRRGKGTNQYLGSVPVVVAEIWAKQCGAPLGSKEFAEYGKKMLLSGDWSKLKAHFQ